MKLFTKEQRKWIAIEYGIIPFPVSLKPTFPSKYGMKGREKALYHPYTFLLEFFKSSKKWHCLNFLSHDFRCPVHSPDKSPLVTGTCVGDCDIEMTRVNIRASVIQSRGKTVDTLAQKFPLRFKEGRRLLLGTVLQNK